MYVVGDDVWDLVREGESGGDGNLAGGRWVGEVKRACLVWTGLWLTLPAGLMRASEGGREGALPRARASRISTQILYTCSHSKYMYMYMYVNYTARTLCTLNTTHTQTTLAHTWYPCHTPKLHSHTPGTHPNYNYNVHTTRVRALTITCNFTTYIIPHTHTLYYIRTSHNIYRLATTPVLNQCKLSHYTTIPRAHKNHTSQAHTHTHTHTHTPHTHTPHTPDSPLSISSSSSTPSKSVMPSVSVPSVKEPRE